jgi:hypothetical protein
MHSRLDVTGKDMGLVSRVDWTRSRLVVGDGRETTLQALGYQLLIQTTFHAALPGSAGGQLVTTRTRT